MSCCQPTDCGPACGSPAAEDAKVQSGVLGFVIEAHPDHMTPGELSLAMNGQRDQEFSHHDAVERAIRELVGAGLLHLAGGLIVPTRAALYCSTLEIG